MKTEKEIDTDILLIMAKIQKDFPELLKYLPEMPVRDREINSNALGVSILNLAEYCNSLVNLVDKYAIEKSSNLNYK
jgi:hypothetical protein